MDKLFFFEERNYYYFLQKFSQFVNPFTYTFAYCLLGNHFHFLIRTKSEEEIRHYLNGKKQEKSVSWHLSNGFGSLFKSYAQAINKGYERTGGLFEEPFHRIEVAEDSYFTRLIFYIHYNPQKHGIVNDFKEYPYSSYSSHISQKHTKLQKTEVLNWFGGKEQYEKFHQSQSIEFGNCNPMIIEFD